MSQLFPSAGVFPRMKVGGAMKVEWVGGAVLTKAGPAGAADIYLADIILTVTNCDGGPHPVCQGSFSEGFSSALHNVLPQIVCLCAQLLFSQSIASGSSNINTLWWHISW